MDRLSEWRKTWQREFNLSMCEAVQFSNWNQKADFYPVEKDCSIITIVQGFGKTTSGVLHTVLVPFFALEAVPKKFIKPIHITTS